MKLIVSTFLVYKVKKCLQKSGKVIIQLFFILPKLWFSVWALVARLVIPRCPSLVHQLPITCSPRDRLMGMVGRGFSTFSYHDISSKTRASASRVIAELWLGSRISFTTSMHAIAAHYSYATLQVIDKEPLLARWFGEIHEDIVIRTVSSSVAIISYLRQILTIYLMIPLFSIHRILKKRFCEPIINRWNEKNTDDKQNQYSQYNQ